jgi:hypothetical protein
MPSPAEKEKYLRLLLSGVAHDEITPPLLKRFTTYSFGDIEKVVVESLKTMVLEGRQKLTKKDISSQIGVHNELIRTAKINK